MLRGSPTGQHRGFVWTRGTGIHPGRYDYNDPRTYTHLNMKQPDWAWINSVTQHASMPTKRTSGGSEKRVRRVWKAHNAPSQLGSMGAMRVRGLKRVRSLRRYPKAVQAAQRMGYASPRRITHEVNSELRCSAGAQAVVTCITERLLPTAARDGTLCNSINREDATTYVAPITAFNTLNQFVSRSADATTATTINHRQDWTMFTNASWRDGYTYINGNLPVTGSANLETGYQTPGYYGTALGNPAGWFTETSVNQQGYNTLSTADGLSLNPTYGAGEPKMTAQLTQLRNYFHLEESITWKFTNNSAVPTHVTVYECILARDVPLKAMYPISDSGTAYGTQVKWGGMPCPIELWRQSREITYDQSYVGEAGQSGSDEYIATAERETRGVTCSQLGENPTATGAQGGLYVKDIDYPNVTPNPAHLLHTWYRLIPHTRVIPPGASTSITVDIKFNRKLPAAWWTNFYGISGLTRCFFLASRPDFVTGIAGLDEEVVAGSPDPKARLRTMAGTDLMVSWTKSKKVAKSKERIKGSIYFRAAIPEIDEAMMRNPVTYKQVEVSDVLDADAAGAGAGAGHPGTGMDL